MRHFITIWQSELNQAPHISNFFHEENARNLWETFMSKHTGGLVFMTVQGVDKYGCLTEVAAYTAQQGVTQAWTIPAEVDA